MSEVHIFGSTTIAKVKNSKELKLLIDPLLKTETIVIKPNWVEYKPGLFTDVDTLRMLIENIDSKIIVIEGHQLFRALKKGEKGLPFSVNGETKNWEWLKQKGWNWMIKNPDWSWFKDSEHWAYLRKLDKRFMDEKGFTDLFQEFDIDFINVTDEIWEGKVTDKTTIKKIVEQKYPPLFKESMYEYIPTKLYKLRGSTLISLNKLKQYGTFTFKNMFGLIPEPIRAWWHGPKNKRKPKSVVAVNKLYDSLFNVIGIVEALKNTPVTSKIGEFNIPGFKFIVHKNLGIIGLSRNRVELDTLMWKLGQFPDSDLEDLSEAEKYYTPCNETVIEDAFETVGHWFPKKD